MQLFPELGYAFNHALTHQVAYENLLQERRRVFHARIVDAIEQLYRDRLAHHGFRGEVWDKALHYCRQAFILAQELGMRPLQAHCHLVLDTLYAKTERLQEARTELSAAIELYCTLEMTFWLTRAECELSRAE